MIKRLTVLILFLGVLSCEEFDDTVPFREFKIPQGKHSSTHRLSEMDHEWLSFEVIFDESAIYETVDPNNQADINKLFGFAECNSNHEENSIRFGWRWFNDELQVFAYEHLDGNIIWEQMGVVELNRTYRFNIFLFDDRYELEVEEFGVKNTIMTRSELVCTKGAYYLLWPYFGGNETAPQDISVFMRRRYDVPRFKKRSK